MIVTMEEVTFVLSQLTHTITPISVKLRYTARSCRSFSLSLRTYEDKVKRIVNEDDVKGRR